MMELVLTAPDLGNRTFSVMAQQHPQNPERCMQLAAGWEQVRALLQECRLP